MTASALARAAGLRRRLDLETYAFLRHAVVHGAAVEWVAEGEPQVGVWDDWTHLPPPSFGGGPAGERWRTVHRFGTLYMRWGVDFCIIRDRRDAPSIITVDDPALLGCLRRLDEPTEHTCTACTELEEHGLAVGDGTRRVLTPVRLRFPPIPFSGI